MPIERLLETHGGATYIDLDINNGNRKVDRVNYLAPAGVEVELFVFTTSGVRDETPIFNGTLTSTTETHQNIAGRWIIDDGTGRSRRRISSIRLRPL